MTGTYNESFVQSFDIAHGASTIDRDIVTPLFKHTSTLLEQVEDLFGNNYVGPLRAADWEPENTLFSLWSGIVDISLFVRSQNSTDLVPPVMKSYRRALDKVRSRSPWPFAPTPHSSSAAVWLWRAQLHDCQHSSHEPRAWQRGPVASFTLCLRLQPHDDGNEE